MSDLAAFLPLIGIALIFWLLVIRPQSRRQKELGRMQSTLEVGDDVMLTSGIHGTIREVSDATISVEISPGVAVTVARGAIGKVLTEADHEVAPDAGAEERDDAADEQDER